MSYAEIPNTQSETETERRAGPFSRLRYPLRGRLGKTAAVVLAIVGINILLAQCPVRTDLTRSREFTLSDQTREILLSLEEDVGVSAFFTGGSVLKEDVEMLLKAYSATSPHVKVHFIDPSKSPSIAREYGVTGSGTLVLQVGLHRTDIGLLNLYEQGTSGEILEFRGEQAITRGIIRLTKLSTTRICLLTGYGGPGKYDRISEVAAHLAAEGYDLQEINLAREGGIPDDIELAILIGPERDLSKDECTGLADFTGRGKPVLVLLASSVTAEAQPNLKTFLAQVGIVPNDDVVVDPTRSYFSDPLSPIPRYEYHEITKKLISYELSLVFPLARSLSLERGKVAGHKIEQLLSTSPEAWGESNWAFDIDRGSNDLSGPLCLSAAVSPGAEISSATTGDLVVPALKSSEDQRGPRMVVVGNSEFVTDDLVGFQGNLDFFMSCVEWLLGDRTPVTIRPRVPQSIGVLLGTEDIRILFGITCLAVPFLVGLAGVAQWWRSRYHA